MAELIESVGLYGWGGLIIIVVLLVLYFKRASRTFGGDTVEITAQQAADLITQEQAVLIDLAEKSTYQKGHIPGAINMPGITFIDGSATIEDASKPMILVPMKGLIPMPVIQYLDSCGVPQIYILKGGTATWQAAGLPM